MPTRRLTLIPLLALFSLACAAEDPAARNPEKKPANAIVLFDGKDLSQWQARDGGEAKFKLVDGGAMEVGGGDIVTKKSFTGDFILHVEFMPNDTGPHKKGQERGNSGVYIQDNYEVQVLDSFGVEKLESGDCAGIYSKKPADKNASKPPGEWQTYHIVYHSPKFDAAGTKTANAGITLDWNGQRVHDNFEIDGVCPGGKAESPTAGPISLQDHGNPVRYRNIWIAPLEHKP